MRRTCRCARCSSSRARNESSVSAAAGGGGAEVFDGVLVVDALGDGVEHSAVELDDGLWQVAVTEAPLTRAPERELLRAGVAAARGGREAGVVRGLT